jgi:hypothetical protein
MIHPEDIAVGFVGEGQEVLSEKEVDYNEGGVQAASAEVLSGGKFN